MKQLRKKYFKDLTIGAVVLLSGAILAFLSKRKKERLEKFEHQTAGHKWSDGSRSLTSPLPQLSSSLLLYLLFLLIQLFFFVWGKAKSGC